MALYGTDALTPVARMLWIRRGSLGALGEAFLSKNLLTRSSRQEVLAEELAEELGPKNDDLLDE